jgi:hypothetical protein
MSEQSMLDKLNNIITITVRVADDKLSVFHDGAERERKAVTKNGKQNSPSNLATSSRSNKDAEVCTSIRARVATANG